MIYKKYIMSIIFLVLVLVLVVLASCSKEQIKTTNTPIDISESNEEQAIYIDILYPQFSQLIPTIDGEEVWENYINTTSRNLINVDIEYIDNDLFFDSKDFLLKENNGLIYIDSQEKLTYLINNNLIQPLNEYVELIEQNESIKENTIKMYSDTSGTLWGVPTHNSISISTREYNEDILNQYNIKIPETIDDFYAVAKRVRSIEESNLYISRFNIEFLTREFKDVFHSYGCYIKEFDGLSYPYGYNPETGQYVDYINSDNFKNAVSFIKTLKDNGYINSDNDQYEYLSQYSHYTAEQTENSSVVISNTESQYIEAMPAAFSCFALLKNNNQTDLYLDFILQKLYQTDELKFAFTYGIEDDHYSLFNGEIMVQPKDNIKDKFFGMKIDYNNSVYDEIEAGYSENIYTTNFIAIEYDKGCFSKCITELFDEIFNKDVSIEDALTSYNKKVESSKLQEFLIELNQK